MADFTNAVVKVLELEGGYQNHPNDLGNYNAYDKDGNFVPYGERKGRTLRAGTNHGISAGFLSGLLKRQVSVAEIKSITQAEAAEIYRQHFWQPIHGDAIHSQPVAEIVLDARVLHGYTGIRLVQRALNRAFGENLADDGIVGMLTLAAINRANPAKLVREIVSIRQAFVRKLAAERPGDDAFLQGWLNRLEKFLADLPKTGAPVGLLIGVAVLGFYLYNRER